MATKKKAQKQAKKTAPKKVAKTAKKQKAAKAKVPFLATEQGMKELKHHCEGIMELIADLLFTRDPKLSQKAFTAEAHKLIKIFFGMDKKGGK